MFQQKLEAPIVILVGGMLTALDGSTLQQTPEKVGWYMHEHPRYLYLRCMCLFLDIIYISQVIYIHLDNT